VDDASAPSTSTGSRIRSGRCGPRRRPLSVGALAQKHPRLEKVRPQAIVSSPHQSAIAMRYLSSCCRSASKASPTAVARSRQVGAGLNHFSQPGLIRRGAHCFPSSSRAPLPRHHCSELAAGASPQKLPAVFFCAFHDSARVLAGGHGFKRRRGGGGGCDLTKLRPFRSANDPAVDLTTSRRANRLAACLSHGTANRSKSARSIAEYQQSPLRRCCDVGPRALESAAPAEGGNYGSWRVSCISNIPAFVDIVLR